MHSIAKYQIYFETVLSSVKNYITTDLLDLVDDYKITEYDDTEIYFCKDL